MPKGTLFRNEAYLKFVREHETAVRWGGFFPQVCHGTSDIHAHHVRMGCNGGMGIKPSDYRVVPLRPHEHQELHQLGEKAFWKRQEVEPMEVIHALLLKYLGIRQGRIPEEVKREWMTIDLQFLDIPFLIHGLEKDIEVLR